MIHVSTHQAYLMHLRRHLLPRLEDPSSRASVETYAYEVVTLIDLSLDGQRAALQDLYCPTGQGAPYDPVTMLRSWLLVTLTHETRSPQVWAARLKREPILAILAGFEPGHTPSATAHRDFLTRYADGPYAQRKLQDRPLSQTLRGRHERRLADATADRQAEADRQGVSQAEALCRQLLDQAAAPRPPHALATRLADLFVQLGLRPSLDAGLFGATPAPLTVVGDGTPLETAASPHGQRTCDCPPGTACDHPRRFTSRTAQWCYHPHRGFVFGDELYTLSTHLNGHDLPLLSIMGRGNESDFTLGPTALDAWLKVCREHDLPLTTAIFVGDGHHDALPIYRYLKARGILPVIPLNGGDASPQMDDRPAVAFDAEGVPLCPGGCRMRHASYDPAKDAHYYACPWTRKQRDHTYRFSADHCPRGEPCRPDKRMGYGVYLPSRDNDRLLPPIPRDSRRFAALYAERASVERNHAVEDAYHLDRATRHAPYALIRRTFVNVAQHARLRWLQRLTTITPQQAVQAALTRLANVPPAPSA